MRVGGSVWELKIDPKRLREEIKTTSKKEEKYENKSIKSDKNSSKSYETHLHFNTEKETGTVWSPGAPREPHARALSYRKKNNGQQDIC